jgi:hypothetical protein
MKPAGIVVAALLALAAQYFVLIRPWYRTWGATAEEVTKPLPGDDRWPDAAGIETRAITIQAPPERVWPWVAQIGQDRGGFYSYRLLENLVGCEMPDAQRVLGLPDPRPGEQFWMYPPRKASGAGHAIYLAVEQDRAMVLGTQEGTWSLVLEPAPGGVTRLLVRGRGGVAGRPEGLGAALFRTLFFEPIHFGMERKMLLGLKERAEGRSPTPAWVDATEVVLWMATFLLGLAAAVAIALRRKTFARPLAAGTAALFVLTLLFFARPPLAIAIVLVALVRLGVSWALRREPSMGSASAERAA